MATWQWKGAHGPRRMTGGGLLDHLLRRGPGDLRCDRTVGEVRKPVNRTNVRDAIQATNLDTLQGNISIDANGDKKSKVVSIFHVQYDTKAPIGDVVHQFKYIGVAPEV
jgi:hypothetical protein